MKKSLPILLCIPFLALMACEKQTAKAPEPDVPDTIQSADKAVVESMEETATELKDATSGALKQIKDKAQDAVDAVKENAPAKEEAGNDMQ